MEIVSVTVQAVYRFLLPRNSAGTAPVKPCSAHVFLPIPLQLKALAELAMR